jgi:hypothetical protein
MQGVELTYCLKERNAARKERDVAVKREFHQMSPVCDGELEFVSERPVKRRFIPTENDEVVSLD